MFYWIKTNKFIKWLFCNHVWSIPNTSKTIYLTFDDGPIPEITEWVLDILKENQIKATFFCVGKNIVKHPEIFKRILIEGHSIGNHTYNHVNGWEKSTTEYINNVIACEKIIQENIKILDHGLKKSEIKNQKSIFFRPPYGKITFNQSKILRKRGYKIIMWDVLSADFDSSISPEQCIKNATQKVESGSIIVFHDSQKAYHLLKNSLPKALAFYKEKGFTFDIIKI
ncbi:MULTISPECIES: polysaccharide deacetylase family protein [Flavobacterium]|uniref:polysaccharide deacetylase family protein n=1 Tax=Flavobacterium TaxID=237 RepID=UPI000745ADB3|nr:MULTISPECIES: polysaccharide deacetylase family protein [Flavobacterium]OXA75448.1 polysaccharide deacetylase family protein [Flavobacterium columnare NBRC 100251 = ATCC 23463]AMA48335.1 polysaccharide deacetylase [Flavobacterium covae]MCJ1806621.1 polysaccharide deacetylase family protein [Flavobacterium covae]MCJ1808438.1 polysaccharide deacetylase family protein [Flavobacterium covae]OWP86538.1 polysaccharide deacetylase family protein [Flavobacterium covae]